MKKKIKILISLLKLSIVELGLLNLIKLHKRNKNLILIFMNKERRQFIQRGRNSFLKKERVRLIQNQLKVI